MSVGPAGNRIIERVQPLVPLALRRRIRPLSRPVLRMLVRAEFAWWVRVSEWPRTWRRLLEGNADLYLPDHVSWRILPAKGQPYSEYNPTVRRIPGGLELAIRVSTLGSTRVTRPHVGPVLNGVRRIELGKGGEILRERLQPPVPAPNLEDIRFVPLELSRDCPVHFVGNRVLASGPDPYRTEVVLLDSDLRVLHALPSPFGRRVEKNWVPVRASATALTLLYSTLPTRLVHVDLRTGQSTVTEMERSPVPFDLHGGTPCVPLADGRLLRVGRTMHRCSNGDRFYFHYFVITDSELSEVVRSRAFRFRCPLEICNGMASLDGRLYLGFGVDDCESWVLEIDELALLDFIERNRWRPFGARSLAHLPRAYRVIKRDLAVLDNYSSASPSP